MEPTQLENLEAQVRFAAQHFKYPPTPLFISPQDLTTPVRTSPAKYYRLRTVGLLIAILIFSLLMVPQVRAAVIEFLQIGVVHIRQTAPAGTPAHSPVIATPMPSMQGTSSVVTASELISGKELEGATTLETARLLAPFPIKLPAYPADLGEPDQVFLQEMNGELLILVWAQPQKPDDIHLALHMIAPGSWALEKIKPQLILETSVDNHPAIWATGPYLLISRRAEVEIGRLIQGNVLIWEQDGLTYRLESNLSLEEAVRIAESIQ